MVVLPSVNMTMTLAFPELVSKRARAWLKASAWLVFPPAVSPSTAVFRSSTDVIIWVFCTAVLAKLTMPMRLPEPISPSGCPPVDCEMMSMKVLAPVFMLASGVPAILPERSRIRAMSVGLE